MLIHFFFLGFANGLLIRRLIFLTLFFLRFFFRQGEKCSELYIAEEYFAFYAYIFMTAIFENRLSKQRYGS